MDEGDIKTSVILKEKGYNALERTYEECGFATHQTDKNFRLLKEIKENGD